MRKSATPVFIVLFFLFSTGAFSQFQQDLYSIKPKPSDDITRLELVLHASGFFNNNEFFGGNVEGYTLTGSWFQPSLKYFFNPNFSLSTGIHLLKYNGQEAFKQVLPVFAIQYSPITNLEITFGSFNQGADLALPEPLYKFENQFTNFTGQGIKIKTKGVFWNSVTWLDWLTFIEPGDPFREEFIFGHSSELKILNGQKTSLGIPFYLLANHKGGQINNNDEPVETRFDLGGGISWTTETDLLVFDRLKANGNVFFELSEENNPDGNAYLGYGELSGKLLSLGLGYFYQKNWDSILGEPLFFSFPVAGNPGITDNHLLFFKAGLGKWITPASSFTLRFEGYYDTNLNRFQYTYGLHIMLNEWIGLLKGFEQP
jgi:hypothetical protein